MPSSLFGPRQVSPQTTIQPQSNSTFQAPENLNQIKGLMNMMQSGGNINGILQTMLQNNPQASTIMNFLNKNGGDPKAAFYDMAKQKGVDPNVVINMLK